MALFGSVGKAFEKVISNPVAQVLFPPFALGNLAALKGISALTTIASPHAPVPSNIQPQDHSTPFYIQQPSQGNAPQPYASGYSGYGGYQDPYYQPYSAGGPQWGYSTPSQVFSIQQSPMYSAPAQGRTWEDLAAGAALFL